MKAHELPTQLWAVEVQATSGEWNVVDDSLKSLSDAEFVREQWKKHRHCEARIRQARVEWR